MILIHMDIIIGSFLELEINKKVLENLILLI